MDADTQEAFPLTYANHYDILFGAPNDTAVYREAKEETVDALSTVLDMDVDGDVVAVNPHKQSVTFDLDAVEEEDVFPEWDDESGFGASYRVAQTTVRTGWRFLDSYEDMADNDFEHQLRVAEGVAPRVKQRLEMYGIDLDRETSSEGFRYLRWTDE